MVNTSLVTFGIGDLFIPERQSVHWKEKKEPRSDLDILTDGYNSLNPRIAIHLNIKVRSLKEEWRETDVQDVWSSALKFPVLMSSAGFGPVFYQIQNQYSWHNTEELWDLRALHPLTSFTQICLQQDSAPAHNAKITTQYLAKHDATEFHWIADLAYLIRWCKRVDEFKASFKATQALGLLIDQRF